MWGGRRVGVCRWAGRKGFSCVVSRGAPPRPRKKSPAATSCGRRRGQGAGGGSARGDGEGERIDGCVFPGAAVFEAQVVGARAQEFEAEGEGAAGADGGRIGGERRIFEAEEGGVGADDGPFEAGGGVAGEFYDEALAGIEDYGLAVLCGTDGERGVGVAAAAGGEGEGEEQEGKNPSMHGEGSFLVFLWAILRFGGGDATEKTRQEKIAGMESGQPEAVGVEPGLPGNGAGRGGGIKTFRGERIC